MTIEILSLIDHHHHSVMPKSVDVANLARYTLALGKQILLVHCSLIRLLFRIIVMQFVPFSIETMAFRWFM